VARARSYDSTDQRLRSSNWFFVPAYNEAWYEALGHLLVARRSDDGDLRLAAYERSVVAWEEFIARAAENDHYLPIARARLALTKKEFAELAKRLRPKDLRAPQKKVRGRDPLDSDE
jgi:hypothetical protein